MLITWHSHLLHLLPQRALFWPAQRALLVADVHFGKAAAFRASGIAVPAGTTAADLRRLDEVVSATGAERLIVLGDLLHARAGVNAHVVDQIGRWRDGHRRLEVIVVRGNHDRAAGDPPAALGFTCRDAPWGLGGADLHHHPPPEQSACPLAEQSACPMAFAGHVHPVVVVSDGGDALRLPCFVVGPRLVLLPAFGSFTGGHRVRPAAGERVYACGPDAVVEVTAAAGRRVGSRDY